MKVKRPIHDIKLAIYLLKKSEISNQWSFKNKTTELNGFYYFYIKFIMTNNIPFTISCIITGIILFQSFFIAPAINKIINAKEASKFLRYIWPKFFLIILILCTLSLFANYYLAIEKNIVKYFMILCIVFMLVCYFITPTINKAKDNSKNKLWAVLHFLTVILTLFTLILNILIINY